MTKEYDVSDIQNLYKDARYMRDDNYLLNLDYLTNFPSKIPLRIRVWMKPGGVASFEDVDVTPQSEQCKALVEDAIKRVKVEICSTKMTKKNWDDAVSFIKGTLRAYSEEFGRVCLREIKAESVVVGSLKMLTISVYYGHYTYVLTSD